MRDYEAARTRLAKVFGADEAPEVSPKSLLIYRTYLLPCLDKKAVLTGREDFLWEEFYVFGPGDKDEYEMLKKKRASYTDEFELIDILDVWLAERYVGGRHDISLGIIRDQEREFGLSIPLD